MNISYKWLKNYINIDVNPNELAAALTSIGLEVGAVETVQTVKGGLEGLVVGEVLTCDVHENSDHLHVTTVNVGTEAPLQIVCGAPNVAVGQKVVVALVGTTLYSGDESFKIKRSKIRGVESLGMLCAEDEIGLGGSHDGIIVLPADVAVGTLAKDYYGIEDDTLLEVDITPNRSDAISHYGVARDVAAYYALLNPAVKLTKPSVEAFKVENNDLTIPVQVENTDACPRYSAVTIANVTIAESPEWLQNALRTIGLRPINNVVDVTNYVLHEMGQALHAFDADKIAGGKVIVKNATQDETFLTLDEVERKLDSADLMICNADKPMCLAGVFGGASSGVTETTKNVFLESAYFNPVTIRKTARRHGLNTDASFRYERGCDPNNTLYVLKRCALLIQEVAGGTIASDVIDIYPNPIASFPVSMSLEKCNSLIGKEIGKENIETILSALEIKIDSFENDVYQLQVPTYRVDVQRDVDVIEDILRIYGYNNIELSDKLHSTLSYSNKPDSHALQTRISEQLTACGFNEILNNSLTKASYYDNGETYKAENCVRMLNALSNDLGVMRQTLLFGGLENIAYNANRRNADLKFYEFGNCYQFDAEKKNPEKVLAAYSEEFCLGMWITGNKTEQTWVRADEKTSFYQMRAYVNNVLRRMGVDADKYLLTDCACSDIFAEGFTITSPSKRVLGTIAIVSNKLRKQFGIDNDVFYANLKWEALLAEQAKAKTVFKEISKFPEVKRDLALLIDKGVKFEDLRKAAFETERKLLKNVTLFDVYEGKNLPSGKKSYALSFILQDDSKTLTDKQIEVIMQKLQKTYFEKFAAELR